MEKINSYRDINPITIVSERYGGGYSKGKYLAFNMEHDWLEHLDPYPIGDDDIGMMDFWYAYHDGKRPSYLIGIGNTPNEAAEDLCNKMKADG